MWIRFFSSLLKARTPGTNSQTPRQILSPYGSCRSIIATNDISGRISAKFLLVCEAVIGTTGKSHLPRERVVFQDRLNTTRKGHAIGPPDPVVVYANISCLKGLRPIVWLFKGREVLPVPAHRNLRWTEACGGYHLKVVANDFDVA